MERLKCVTIIFLLTLGLSGPPGFAKPASVLLQEGLYSEEVEGNLDAAIKIYEQIINDRSAQRPHVAQAIYRQGMCYLKKQDEPRARAAFEKLAAEFSDQTNIIEKIQPLLEEMSNPDPAALMPPETLVYLEIGSPGRQIETILNMLKGTPFENPLAAIGQGKGQQQRAAGQKSPGDIIVALLNPSMMAEFKKIRGMAIGITGIAKNNPPLIALLYPGKSDALRGLILAAIGIVAQPSEPVEGMETLIIEGVGGVAYDDRVIIVAAPLERLTWCVKQYKGITSEPTFATNNKSFAKVPKQARQENALTIWANLDQVYARLLKEFPDFKVHPPVRIADTVADFESIDDLVAFLSIQEDGIALEANVAFKPAHNCLAYNLIRTPNLSRDGFRGVPASAVALISSALSEPHSFDVATAQKAVKNLTGLDIGREIFANIEQITLFVVPPSSSESMSGPPIRMLSCLGVAVTSHNPQQTRLLLTQIFGMANLLAGRSMDEELAAGKYLLPLGGDQQIYCHIGQVDKTTILAFGPEVLEASTSAIKRNRSALTSGPLHEPLSQMAADTSKVTLVNIGGAIRLADMHVTMANDNPQNPVHKTLAQLALACEKSCVQLRTQETVDNFSFHVEVDGLPPLDSIFPMLMQLSEADFTAKAEVTGPQPRDGAVMGPREGIKLNWKRGIEAVSHKVYFGDHADELSLLAEVSRPDEVKLPALQEGGQYYWRVDEIWSDGTVITGDVWDFTIGKQVAWWRLDETTGVTAKDSAGNNDGTLIGDPQWRPAGGRINAALELDGDGDYVEITNESNFDITQRITVAAWVKVSRFDKEWQAVVTKGDSSWRIQRNEGTNSLEFACSGLKVPSGTPWGNLFGKRNVNDGKWHHVVGVYDGRKMYIYIDGTLDTSQAASGSINTNDEPVYIGENSERDGRCWNGLIDDVRVFNYALSEDEIAALYKGQ